LTRRLIQLRAAAGLLGVAGTILALIAPGPGASAARQSAPTVNYRERPRYPFDAQRLKRRPTLDGALTDNEWDPLYTINDTAAKGTVYVNWDDDNLYVATRTDQPAWLLLDVDCNADGWLRGADNLELSVAPGTDSSGPVLTARILDAAGNKDAPVWNERVVDPRSIQVVQKAAGNGQVTELAIPRGIAGLTPRGGATLALRADLLPASATPAVTPPYEPHLLVDVALVDARTISAPGLTPRVTLEDSKLVPGQPLRATLDLINQTEEETRVRSVSWQGDGGAADILNTVREVGIPSVTGLKTLKRKYSSTLPETAVPGFYQITAKAELENGKTVLSTASFSVVEPFTLQIATDPDPVNVVGPTLVKIFIDIKSAIPNITRGDVQIEVPAGWEVKGRSKKEFFVNREDTGVRAPFYVTLPSSTQTGDYIVNATVTWRGKSWKVHRTLKVTHAAEATPAEKKDK
jgi:hypothetical protein